MNRTAAAAGILALLLLSGCRIDGDPGMTTSPGQSPEPVPTVQPTATASLAPTETAPPTEPPGLTAEELTALALGWCETYADRFAGYDAIRMSRAYWFADYAGVPAQVPFTTADGGDGTVFFLPDPGGVLGPGGAAGQLLGQSAEQLILVDRDRMVEEMGRRLAALAGEGLNEAAALDAFLKNAQDTPALTEDTWYCVDVDDTGYLLMAYQDGYRLQRRAALVEYAVSPEFQVRPAWDRAAQGYGWLTVSPLPKDEADSTPHPEESGATLYRVDYPGISSMLELRSYLKTIFSDEIADGLFAYDRYTEVDGVLYESDRALELLPRFSGPTTVQVLRESATRLVYRMSSEADSADYVYEKVGDRWLFTEFPYLITVGSTNIE